MPESAVSVVIGAGPAGLTAAYDLVKHGLPVAVFEADDVVGGISRTVERDGWRFDIGGHRFFTKVARVEQLWHEILPDEDFLLRPRMSRIYYRGKLFDYPLKAGNALRGLGVAEALRCIGSYAWARIRPPKDQTHLDAWVTARFGKRLFSIFFKTYTEKVWGMKTSELPADWAAQRIKNLSLTGAIRNAVLPKRNQKEITSLIEEFQYPKFGPGMMWERCTDLVRAAGGTVTLGTSVNAIHWEPVAGEEERSDAAERRDAAQRGDAAERGESAERSDVAGSSDAAERSDAAQLGRGAVAVSVTGPDGVRRRIPASHVVSSMPISALVRAMEPPAPPEVLAAANDLRYRDFLTVALVVPVAAGFPDNWIYIHTPGVNVGRIQNFGSWSPFMVKEGRTCLGLEFFVNEGDELWSMADEDLVRLATGELEQLGLIEPGQVEAGYAVRMPKAYPVYDDRYQKNLEIIREWLDAAVPNVHPVGRNGMHRYNNQDHSMLTALLTAENIRTGSRHDVWSVNVEEEYHETGSEDGGAGGESEKSRPRGGGGKGRGGAGGRSGTPIGTGRDAPLMPRQGSDDRISAA